MRIKILIVLFSALISAVSIPVMAEKLIANPPFHIDLLTPYLKSDCPARLAIGDWEKKFIADAQPLSFEAYNTYFNDVEYEIRTSVRHKITAREFGHSRNVIRGRERLSNFRFETTGGVRYRYESIVGASWRPVPEYKTQLYVNFESPERVSAWREDCKAFLRIKTIGHYVQFDPTVYNVRYKLDKRVGQPKLYSVSESGNLTLNINGWNDHKRVVVMRTCYKNSHPTDGYLDIICTEHDLTDPSALPDLLLVRRDS